MVATAALGTVFFSTALVGLASLSTRAHAAPSEAVPVVSGTSSFGEGAILPEILSAGDRARYHAIFADQREGRFQAADREIKALHNRLLQGVVLRQRYLSRDYRSRYDELASWLAHYGTEPDADEIYRLAERRKPRGARVPHPSVPDLDSYGVGQSAGEAEVQPARSQHPPGSTRPLAWRQGLQDWIRHDYAAAATHFAELARAKNASVWDVTAGAFWAARAYARSRDPGQVDNMLALAARYPRTFYGLLAVRQLGEDVSFSWDIDPSRYDDFINLARIPGVARAIALYEAGEPGLAGDEVEWLYEHANPGLAKLLLALAGHINVPAAAIRMGEQWRLAHGQAIDAALYPVPPWHPEGGFTIDRALVYAFMRQESAFDAKAESAAGAKGLMQLMPKTARLISGEPRALGHDRARLFKPEYNIGLGQRYLHHLLATPAVHGNLILLAAAYNAGPGALQRWQKAMPTNDPLLFIETLPSAETRTFVQRVMAGFWLYQERLGQDPQTLDVLAGGKWPYYVAEDDTTVVAADYAGQN